MAIVAGAAYDLLEDDNDGNASLKVEQRSKGLKATVQFIDDAARRPTMVLDKAHERLGYACLRRRQGRGRIS